jgi:hypothetical protein
MAIGAMLDRAVAFYVRNFVTLNAAYAFAWVPIIALQLLILPDLTAPLPSSADGDAQARILATLSRQMSAGGGVALIAALITPVGANALLVTAAGILDGSPVALGTAVGRGVRRWVPAVVALVLLLLLFGIVGSIAFFVPAAAVGLVVAGTAALSVPMSWIVGVPLGVAAVAFWLVLLAFMYIALGMCLVVVPLEEGNPVRAIGLALERTFDPHLRRRTLLVGLAYGAVQLVGLYALIGLAAVLAAVTHLTVPAALLGALGQSVMSALLLLFMLFYTRDVRVRREGVDLLAAVAEPAT